MKLNDLAREIHEIATNNGWHENELKFGEYIALFHSEISEALEQYRFFGDYRLSYRRTIADMERCHSYHNITNCNECNIKDCIAYSPEGVTVDLIDCVIRIFDFLAKHQIDIDDILARKMNYNRIRGYKHGGKHL